MVVISLVSILFLFTNCGSGFQQKTYPSTGDNNENNGGGNGGSGGGGTGGTPTAAQNYFTSTLTPLLQINCSSCHTVNKAPVRIFDYTFLKSFALVGPSASNNPLYNKVRDIQSHGIAGAILLGDPTDLCPLDVRGSVSPCREIRTWILLENPQLNDSGILGQINYVSLLGEVSGYAINAANTAASINVVVYANAPYNQGGQLIGTFPANLTALNTVENNHTFRFQLPDIFRDGSNRKLYVYGINAANENLLFNSPYSYTAFPASGRTYFNNNVAAKLTCQGCHFWVYEEAFTKLAMPLFSAGGSATNNTLINKMSGAVSHGGGNQCPGGMGAEPCLSVRNWWAQEFD